jgi:vacuolar-type H+-ATPase subunit I/STV1
VFDEPKLEVKPVISDKVVFGSDEELPSPVKKVKESSSKQRDHLKKAREKALETRRAKAKERKIVEDEKKALRQQKREEKEKLMIEKEDKEHAKEVKNIEVKPHSYMKEFTQEQLIELQQKAIENYEVKRKATKKIKKEQIAKDTADKKVYESITKAIGPVQAQDPWADCFR